MRFAEPKFLYLLWLIPIIFGLYIFYIRRRKAIKSRIGEPQLVDKMWDSVNYRCQTLKFYLLLLCCFFLVLTLARPQWGKRLEHIKRKGLDIMFILDLSKSMLAQDIQPSRLMRAKMEISSFIDKLRGDRVGICGFAGESFVSCPLTLDYSAAKLFLDILNVETIPVPGTRIGDAILKAKNALSVEAPGEQRQAICVLITDGEDLGSDWQSAAMSAKDSGIRVYTVGIGMPEGEPIPDRDENGNVSGYKKDNEGKVVMSRLNEQVLQSIAMITGGGYTRGDLGKVYSAISRLDRKEFEEEYQAHYQDRFQWLLLPALLAFILNFLIPDRKREVRPQEIQAQNE